MRELADSNRIERFMSELGRAVQVDSRVYFTGGATAVLHGWRETTIDVEDFIPLPAGWEDRSPLIRREGQVSFHHFDPVAQALSKIERGHDQDLQDVREMIARGLVDTEEARAQFESIEPELYRFPAIDPASFRRAVEEILRSG
jgi:hypothetical protein